MKRLVLLFTLLVMVSCTASPTPTPTAVPATPMPTPAPPTATTQPTEMIPTATAVPTALPTAAATVSQDPVIAGAGDIAVCQTTGSAATAKILDTIEGLVFTLGDNSDGSAADYACYDQTWGRFKARTHPVPGNHDYSVPGASEYFKYFGASAGDPDKGYYSYDVGTWHIVALNSEIDTTANSPQVEWLRADLQAHPATCTVAMLHRPLFSSGLHGNDGNENKTRPLWDVLYEYGADLVLAGHDHSYERFAPQNPQGELDEARGIREFVAGTGGDAPGPFVTEKANSEKRFTGPFGILKLTLHPTSYDWEFISILPLLFHDKGRGQCH